MRSRQPASFASGSQCGSPSTTWCRAHGAASMDRRRGSAPHATGNCTRCFPRRRWPTN
ncbi:hypothetical protein GBAR_LOCUS14249 [Geodia barretti]|uniref:Uncharacterized protein n=1 Tax=Geodia barretti TaxID=519541 RepID=A0AA35S950_GEOBA|nr:hypothetical protein GBAR_LOCUS14249 [Geodia barretti]